MTRAKAAWRRGLARVLRIARLPSAASRAVAQLLRRNNPWIADLPDVLVLQLASSPDPVHRAIVQKRPLEGITSADVLTAVDRAELIGPAALLFDEVPAAPGERSEAVHRAIVLDSASYPLRQHTAFLCVRRHANEVTIGHARGIVRRCLSLAAQPVDPYAPVPAAMAARTAAAALIADHPVLDDLLHDRLRLPTAQAALALVQAASLQARRAQFAEGVAAAIEAMSLDERQAVGFARDCDSQYSAADSAAPRKGRVDRWTEAIGTFLIRVAVPIRALLRAIVVVALPLIGVALALAVDHWIVKLPRDVSIGPGEVLAALGVLVAVHVLSAELAADRLAGPVANATSFPLALQAGYLAGILLLVSTIVRPSRGQAATVSTATIGVIASLIVLVLIALVTLLARTDPVRAVEAFVRRERARVLAAGRTLGRHHRTTLRQRRLIAGFPWATDAATVPRGERRAPIVSGRWGYFVLHERRAVRLDRRSEYQQERLRVAVVEPIGLPVSSGDEVLSLIPASDAVLTAADVRRARRLVRVRRQTLIDQVGEFVGTLLGIATTQATSGNVGGADRVRDGLLRLLDLHLRALRTARGSGEEENQTIGMIPALRIAAVQGLRGLAEAKDANTREVLLGFLQRLLVLTDAADTFAAMLATQLSASGQTLPTAATNGLLWDCGSRAIELNDTLGITVVRSQIEQLLNLDDSSAALGGRLVQFAAITRPRRAEGLWRWHRDRFETVGSFALTAMRIGGSALNVGNASLAVSLAISLRSQDASKWVEYFARNEVADHENALDRLYGHLLGADPQQALIAFARFVGRINKAVSP